MREIIFRGRRLDNGEWVYGDLEQFPITKGLRRVFINTWEYFTDKNGVEREIPVRHEVDPETVGQYTGLKDKNDAKIYEGDVVDGSWTWYEETDLGTKETIETRRFVVKWFKGGLALKEIDEACYSYFPDLEYAEAIFEVIGNIHENPELLEDGEG